MLEVSRKLVMLGYTRQKMLTMNIFSGIRSEEQINVFAKYKQGSSVLTSWSYRASILHLHFQCRGELLSLAASWTEVRIFSFCFVLFSLSGVLLRIH